MGGQNCVIEVGFFFSKLRNNDLLLEPIIYNIDVYVVQVYIYYYMYLSVQIGLKVFFFLKHVLFLFHIKGPQNYPHNLIDNKREYRGFFYMWVCAKTATLLLYLCIWIWDLGNFSG